VASALTNKSGASEDIPPSYDPLQEFDTIKEVYLEKQKPLQPVSDPLELTVADLFNRLAELGSKARTQKSTQKHTGERASQFTWETSSSASNPTQNV
jgi:hypothetical protein